MNSYLLQILLHFYQLHVPTEKKSFLSNPIPYTEYLYLSISTFLVKLTDPNKFSRFG